MAELNGRIRHDETKLATEHAQHSAAAKDLVQAHEQILELKRRTRVAVSIAVTFGYLIIAHRRHLAANMTLDCVSDAGCNASMIFYIMPPQCSRHAYSLVFDLFFSALLNVMLLNVTHDAF